MKLQDLLKQQGIDITKTKLVRHNLSGSEILENYKKGYLDLYQSIQPLTRFADCEYIISFLGFEGTEGKFLGCYKIIGTIPLDTETLPPDFTMANKVLENCVFWKTEKTSILAELINRLVIDWGKSAINWCQNATTEKEVLYILPQVSEIEFTSYDKVLLSFEALSTIVANNKKHKEWESRLSSVAGIYLITDTKTGKHYVGSASGSEGGIWARWSNYAKTKHGGNKLLIELIQADPDYCNNFLFSILEVFPIKRDRLEILEYEALYKKKLCTMQFGLNDN